jgi:hypothetical protein
MTWIISPSQGFSRYNYPMHNAVIWRITFEDEFDRAEKARAAGNEGKARVCARRAAGAVVGEYLSRQGIDLPTSSAHDRLRYLRDMSSISVQARQAASHLLTRVTPEFALPVEADLIAEARGLRQELLEE